MKMNVDTTNSVTLTVDDIGDSHIMTSVDTPVRPNAFERSDEEKIDRIAKLFYGIMEELGLDLDDDSLSGTPYRIAKMYVRELFDGLNPENQPKLSTFDNKYAYGKMLVEKDIRVSSACEHHFLPIIGRAHIAYIAEQKVIGLSKINRIVEYYSHRPQVQERLTLQIFHALRTALGTDSIIVVIDAEHLCVSARGVKDDHSRTATIEYGGVFEQENYRREFFDLIK
ncbi:GTP cyclohydrolase I FolE [Sphingobacterium sp. DN00404]|uniref:GTP cyclohydrolase 1 n=1 Tax=Sphingobacterium micropteri TaxID=2763501 RepID=A0ABR7YNW2_9SPHI|nr:GTP cyclohydrolase I FolE [Sphingobacterium micropteri]MBD1433001.1 GTP cyclohydrolase I FolE [Sphingobacterium micropteri]